MSTDIENPPDELHELHQLEHVADVGESDKTPLILLGEVWFWCAFAVLSITAITLLAVRVGELGPS
jgi:hypothetical protein